MQFRNNSNGPVNVCGGIVQPWRYVTVSDETWNAWLDKASANRDLADRRLKITIPPEEKKPQRKRKAADNDSDG